MPAGLSNGTTIIGTGTRVAVERRNDEPAGHNRGGFCEVTSPTGNPACGGDDGGSGGGGNSGGSGGGGFGGLPGNRNPVARDDIAGELVWFEGDRGVIGNLLANDFDPDGDTIQVAGFVEAEFLDGVFSQLNVSDNGDVQFTAVDAETNAPTSDFDHPRTTRFQYTIVDFRGGFDVGEAVITIVPEPPDITISVASGDILDFVEGGDTLSVTIELSEELTSDLVIRPEHDFLADLSIQSELVVPAGVKIITLALGFAKSELAVGDFTVEAGAESGPISFSAAIIEISVDILEGEELPFVIREEVTNVPPPEATQRGLDAAELFRNLAKTGTDIGDFVRTLDSQIAKELYLESLDRITKAVEPAFILNGVSAQLDAGLDAADAILRFNISDPTERELNQIAYANARYDAFKRSFVDATDQLSEFLFASGGAAVATGFITGLAVGGTVAGLPVVAAATIGAVVVGQATGVFYDAALREFVRDAAGAAFEFDNPRAGFVNATVDSFNLDMPEVTGGDLLIPGNNEPDDSLDEEAPILQNGGDGDDVFHGSSASDTLVGGGGDDTMNGLLGDDLLFGGVGADVIRGAAGDDSLRGNAGDDHLLGGGGADNIRGGGGADDIRGGGGSDVIKAGGGADTVKGGGGADNINGGGGADHLQGGGGADTLTGRGGDDTLRGNGGADVFQFRANDRNETILDFRQGLDKIEIESGANSFDALDIEQDGRDVLIGFGAGQVRVVTDQAAAFDENDFVF